jgi:hypothetical protein
MPPKAPDLPHNIIEPRLSATALMAHNIRPLFRNAEWITVESRNAQLVFVEEFARKDCGITFDILCLADVFELTRSRIRTIHAKAQKRNDHFTVPWHYLMKRNYNSVR